VTWRNLKSRAQILKLWVYYKTYGNQKIEVVAKQNDKKEWIIISVWSRRSMMQASQTVSLIKLLKIFSSKINSKCLGHPHHSSYLNINIFIFPNFWIINLFQCVCLGFSKITSSQVIIFSNFSKCQFLQIRQYRLLLCSAQKHMFGTFID
jgi:hypothetical protein